MTEANNAETIADLARKAATVQTVTGGDGRTYLVVPDGYTAKDVSDPHGLFPGKPRYVHQRVEVQTLDSLVEYVNIYKSDSTRLFADIKSNSIAAVVDYHGASGQAENAAHVVTMALRFSEEWALWTGIDGQLHGQLEFARFLEENHPDIVQPNAAELIEVARDLHAARNIRFTKVVRTDSDNESFTIDDSTNLASNRSGEKVELPRQFTLSIPVYFGERTIDMSAFLRWKLADSDMKLGIKLWRPEHVRQAMFREIVLQAAERTALVAVFGKLC